MKFDERMIPKGHPKPSQIGAAGTQGPDFYDLGRFYEAPFFEIFGTAKLQPTI